MMDDNEIKYYIICNEDISNIENYSMAKKDEYKNWVLHHRLETHFSDGTLRPKGCQISSSELKLLGMYYNIPAKYLVFMRKGEHKALHNSLEIRKGQNKGNVPWNKGKHHSKETKQKISAAHKGKKLSEETRNKLSEVMKKRIEQGLRIPRQTGKHRFNDGEINIFECPIGFQPGWI